MGEGSKEEDGGEDCVQDGRLWEQAAGVNAVAIRGQSHSLPIQSDIDLNSPLISYHSSTYKPTALIAISIIGNFIVKICLYQRVLAASGLG